MGASPSRSRGNARESPSHTSKLTENARKIATPPKRGSGASWTCRPSRGAETQPLRVAMSRTSRVATNDRTNENANKPKNRSVKVSVPFRPKYPASHPMCAAREVSVNTISKKEFPLGCARRMKWLLFGTIQPAAVDQQLFQPYLLTNFQGSRTPKQSVQRRFYFPDGLRRK